MPRKAKEPRGVLPPLARFVKERRLEKHLSMAAVGKALGTGHSTISKLESDPGYTLPKRHYAPLAAVLETDIAVLLELDGLRPPRAGEPTALQQEAINVVLAMSPARLVLAKTLLRALLEDEQRARAGPPPMHNGAPEV